MIGPACRGPSLPLIGIKQVGRKPKQAFHGALVWRRGGPSWELSHEKLAPAVRVALGDGA